MREVQVAAFHRLVPLAVFGFGINVASGAVLLMTDPDQYVYNSAFHLKLVCLALAGANVMVFYLTVFRRVKPLGPGAQPPPLARLNGVISLALWITVIICGRMITFYRPNVCLFLPPFGLTARGAPLTSGGPFQERCRVRFSCHQGHSTGTPSVGLDEVPKLTNNVTVARKALAIVLSLAVQGAAVGAPLAHVHPDDHATDHHRGRAIHTHWADHAHPRHPADAPVLDDDDHVRAVFVNTFVSVAASALPAGAAPHQTFELPIPAETTMHRPVEVTHGHDPPYCSSVPSRAPPASFLS